MNFLASLQASPIGEWVQSSYYGYYLCLSGHAIGMGAVVGAVFMLCLRVLGFAKGQPLVQFEPLFTLAKLGFLLNAATGVALFMANGENLIRNPPFLIKIAFVIIGGMLVWRLWRQVRADPALAGDEQTPASQPTRILAIATFACWLMAIMAGRIIGYTIDY